MFFTDFSLGGKTLRLSVYAENIIRVRVSKSFELSLFERYKVFKEPEETGEKTANGVRTGRLDVAFDGADLVIANAGKEPPDGFFKGYRGGQQVVQRKM